MSTVPDEHKLSELLLVRIAAQPKRGLSEADVRRSLEKLMSHAMTPREWSDRLSSILAHLEDEGLLTRKPLRLTEAGRTRAARFLGMATLPARLDWRRLLRSHLVARALELDPAHAHTDRVRAAIVARRHGIPPAAATTLARATDVLVWRELGFDAAEPLTLGKLRARVLERVLGAKTRLDADRMRAQLAAAAAGAPRADAASLQTAVLRRWLAEKGGGAEAGSDDLTAFARAVHEAAERAGREDRFGDREVFISSIWRRLARSSVCAGMSASDFKQRLAEANRAGLLRLHRADLVAAMDPRAVAESETHYLNATFHFVEIEPRSIEP